MTSRSTLRKETLGLRDDALNVRDELGLWKSHNVKPSHSVGVFDHYADGDGWIHLHARIVWAEGDRSEWCAVFQSERGYVGDSGVRGVDSGGGDLGVQSEDVPMLVPVVELLEFDQGPRVALSVIRLQPLDECLRRVPQLPDLISTVPSLRTNGRLTLLVPVIGREAGTNGEGSGLVAGPHPIVHCERHDQVVKGATGIVDAVSEQCWEGWGKRSSNAKEEVFANAIRIGLGDHTQRVGLVPGAEFYLEAFQMFNCPRKLGIDAGVIGHPLSSTHAREGAGDANHAEGYADPNAYAGGVRRQSRQASQVP